MNMISSCLGEQQTPVFFKKKILDITASKCFFFFNYYWYPDQLVCTLINYMGFKINDYVSF